MLKLVETLTVKEIISDGNEERAKRVLRSILNTSQIFLGIYRWRIRTDLRNYPESICTGNIMLSTMCKFELSI